LELVLHALVLHVLPQLSLVSHIMMADSAADSMTRKSNSNSSSVISAPAGRVAVREAAGAMDSSFRERFYSALVPAPRVGAFTWPSARRR
jgi:hypothetical protein